MSRLARPSAVAIGISFAALFAVAGLLAVTRSPAAATAAPSHWITTWASAPQAAVPGSRAARGFRGQTLREIVVASAAGVQARIQVSNAFGSRPLSVAAASLETLPGGIPAALAFGGQPGIVIPPGATVLSDPLTFVVAPRAQLAISLYLPASTGPATENANTEQTSYLAGGDRVMAQGLGSFSAAGTASYFLTGVDVVAPASDPGAIAALGDSITDGVGSNLDAGNAWPTDLARRLPGWGVFNAGIGGNRLLNSAACCGVDAVARFQRDVAAHSGVRAVILLEGVNDIGFSRHHDRTSAPHTIVSAAQIIAGDEMLIGLAHADGLKIFGATLTPFKDARYWTPAGEAVREAVNAWILHGNRFDGVIDFATVLGDPSDPQMLNPPYDSGDHLHPNAAGYERMASAIDLTMLRRAAA